MSPGSRSGKHSAGILSNKSNQFYNQRVRQIMKDREKKVLHERRALSKRNSLENNVIIEESQFEQSPSPKQEVVSPRNGSVHSR